LALRLPPSLYTTLDLVVVVSLPTCSNRLGLLFRSTKQTWYQSEQLPEQYYTCAFFLLCFEVNQRIRLIMFVQFCLTALTLRVSFVSQFALLFVRRLLTLDVFTSSFSFNESLFFRSQVQY